MGLRDKNIDACLYPQALRGVEGVLMGKDHRDENKILNSGIEVRWASSNLPDQH